MRDDVMTRRVGLGDFLRGSVVGVAGGGRVRLECGEIWRSDRGGVVVEGLRVVAGRVWLTDGVTGRDWVLGVGGVMKLDHGMGERWLMESLGGEAVVELGLDFGDDPPGRDV